MEKLTTEQIEDIVDDLNNFDFLPVTPNGVEEKERICKGTEQMRDELLAYKRLEEQIGCPLEVKCKLYTGMPIYDENEVYYIARIDEDDFMCYNHLVSRITKKFKDYKIDWWLKADKSE